ncbi:NUDIX hydrolase [Streptomyces sp. NBC_00005]|uniref:NUDIX hydrolase n=1 Tax=Streptomyces sp. NBC_00005 TaxID=2903609 RepID=UPI003254449D
MARFPDHRVHLFDDASRARLLGLVGAVVRECREELGIEAVASPVTGERPLFLTVTRTRGQRADTDVSLWYLLDADARTITSYDRGEFDALRWLTEEEVLEESGELLDPHIHRFIRKLQHAAREAG